MKCLVCNSVHQQNACYRCGFPVVEIPGDYEAGLKALQPTVVKFRNDFTKKVGIALVAHVYEDGDNYIYRGKKLIFLGKVSDLLSKDTWLDVQFTNVVSRKSFPIDLNVSVEGQSDFQVTIETQNISSETIQLGISVDGEFNCRFMLMDSFGNTVSSAAVPLFT